MNRPSTTLHPDEEAFAHLLRDNLTATEEKELEEHQGEYRRTKSEKFFDKFVRPLLPNAKVSGTGNVGNPIWFHRAGWITALHDNASFRGSRYDYPLTSTNRLVHYTSAQTLLSILREASIRLYDLNHMDDPKEFSFGARDFGYSSNHQLKEARSQLFSFSLVPIDEKCEEEDFNLWQYGDNGNGVAIVFSIDSGTQYEWNNFHLSPVNYSATIPAEFERFSERVKQFGDEEYFWVKQHEGLLVKLAAFHKSNIFAFEREVRLLRYYEHELYYRDSARMKWPRDIGLDVGRNGQRSFFDRLYLGQEWESRYRLPAEFEEKYGAANRLFPKLKIERVILGYRLNPINVWDLQESIHILAHQNLGYSFEITKSKFFDHFSRREHQEDSGHASFARPESQPIQPPSA